MTTSTRLNAVDLELRRVKVAELYAKGQTLAEIAQATNGTINLVWSDLQVVQRRWAEKAVEQVDIRRSDELLKIDNLEKEAWDAYRRSLGDLVEDYDGQDPRGSITYVKKTNRDGGEHFLRVVQWCIERRCKLLGLDAPVKIAPTTPDGNSGYDPLANVHERLIGKLFANASSGASQSSPEGANPDGGGTATL